MSWQAEEDDAGDDDGRGEGSRPAEAFPQERGAE